MAEPLAPRLEVSDTMLDSGVRLVALRGELDVATLPAVAGTLDDAAGNAASLAIDLVQVTFIDSTALMTLLNALRRMVRRDARLALACSNPTVLRVFEMTGTDNTFAIFPTREAALAQAARS